jgi:anti-sigma B factor antagonist
MGLLTVRSYASGDTFVVEPTGDLDLSTAGELRATFTDAFEGGYTRLVVLLDGLDFMDSSGLGLLVGALKRARADDGSVELVCSRPFLVRTLKVTGLDRVFTVHRSSEGVVPAASAGRRGRRRLPSRRGVAP